MFLFELGFLIRGVDHPRRRSPVVNMVIQDSIGPKLLCTPVGVPKVIRLDI
jgi:hypothetical protein